MKTKSEFNLLEIELTNHKLKTLDVINVKIGEGNYKKYLVSVAGRKVYIDYQTKNTTIKVQTTK